MGGTARLRVVTVDGKRIGGVKRSRHVAGRPLPSPSMVKMAEKLAAQVRLSERLVKVLHLATEEQSGVNPLADPLVIQAIARSALVEMNGLGNLADYLAEILPDPSRW